MKRIGSLSSAFALSACAILACSGDGPVRDAGPDGGPPADAGDAGDAGAPTYALFVGTDFTRAELSVVSLYPDSVEGRLPLVDQDSVPFASGGVGSLLEDTVGNVIILDRAQPWTVHATIDVNDAPDAAPFSSNPRTVLVTAGPKAYVARYGSNVVKIVDVAAGIVTGSVDLSAFVAPDDSDGVVDVQDGVYDPATKRAYFLLQRIDQLDFGPDPDNVGACLASHGEIVAVDVTTDAIVDLDGDAGGQAIDLLGSDPASLSPDFAHGRIIVADTGCRQLPDGGADAGPALRLGRGVESVALGGEAPTWLYQTTDIDRLSGLVWVDGTHAFVNLGDSWFAWNPTVTALGDAVPGFPQAPLYDGHGRVVGLSVAQPDAGSDAGVTWSVVALDVATLQISSISASPFQTVVPASQFGVSSALLQ